MVSILIIINILPRTIAGPPCAGLLNEAGAVGMKKLDYGFPFTSVTRYTVEPNTAVCTYPEFQSGKTEVNVPLLLANLLIAAGAVYIGVKLGYKLADKNPFKKPGEKD
jgi:hypothetical protein